MNTPIDSERVAPASRPRPHREATPHARGPAGSSTPERPIPTASALPPAPRFAPSRLIVAGARGVHWAITAAAGLATFAALILLVRAPADAGPVLKVVGNYDHLVFAFVGAFLVLHGALRQLLAFAMFYIAGVTGAFASLAPLLDAPLSTLDPALAFIVGIALLLAIEAASFEFARLLIEVFPGEPPADAERPRTARSQVRGGPR